MWPRLAATAAPRRSARNQGTAAFGKRPERLVAGNDVQDLVVVPRLAGFGWRLHLREQHVHAVRAGQDASRIPQAVGLLQGPERHSRRPGVPAACRRRLSLGCALTFAAPLLRPIAATFQLIVNGLSRLL